MRSPSGWTSPSSRLHRAPLPDSTRSSLRPTAHWWSYSSSQRIVSRRWTSAPSRCRGMQRPQIYGDLLAHPGRRCDRRAASPAPLRRHRAEPVDPIREHEHLRPLVGRHDGGRRPRRLVLGLPRPRTSSSPAPHPDDEAGPDQAIEGWVNGQLCRPVARPSPNPRRGPRSGMATKVPGRQSQVAPPQEQHRGWPLDRRRVSG